MVRPRVFFDVTAGTEQLGRIIFELYNETAPKTCENFRALCTGEKGQTSGIPLYYKNSIFHRCIKDFMIQGGDFTKQNGTGGESIYGGTFDDEDLSLPIDSEGLLCMANKGPNSNGSQFFITLRACPHLDGKHVVFGRVLRGFEEVVRKIEQVPCDAKDRPSVPIIINNCGELELRKKVQPLPAKPEKRSVSVSGSDSEDNRKRSKRRSRRSRSRSLSADDSDGGEKRRHRKKSKRKHVSDKKERKERSPSPDAVPRKETEEEYDTRLEREEKERMEEARKRHLEKMKTQYESESQSSNGIRYKGRGRMKYIDPDVNYNR
ncbi:peptidyl-prolyl cis-trans isomerase [Moniliophthora roreri MCA 2997]|uniref:Peptidyl-prolyl cis-trans isomerase D n=1 Tax=Moniliophthora roreri (strain MCA 2997) TaxID=1381753 RepID=V2WR28_MONRO|nr:peptidyl-prolyl cis-trans isomerase [Moniliophthora roreri MCA 2997]